MKNKFLKKVMLMLMVAVMVVTTPVGQAVDSITGIDVVQTVEAEGWDTNYAEMTGVKEKKKWNKWVKISKKSKYKGKFVTGSPKKYKETYQTYYKYRITKKKNINKCYKQALKYWNKNQNFLVVGNAKYVRAVYDKLEKTVGKKMGLDLNGCYFFFSPVDDSTHNKGYTNKYDWNAYPMTAGESVKYIKSKLNTYKAIINRINNEYATQKDGYAITYANLTEDERYFEFVKNYLSSRMTTNYDKAVHNSDAKKDLYHLAYTDEYLYTKNECNRDGASYKNWYVTQLTARLLALQGYDVRYGYERYGWGEVYNVEMAVKVNSEAGWWYYSNKPNYKEIFEQGKYDLFLNVDRKVWEKEGSLDMVQYNMWEFD